MNVRAPTWFEDDDPRELRRWIIAAAVVVAVHLSAIAAYVYFYGADEEIGGDAAPVSIELAPIDDAIDQPEIAPQLQAKPVETQRKELEPPPPSLPDAVAMPEQKPVEQPDELTPPPAPAMTKGGAPTLSAEWESELDKRLQRHKRYPGGARARGEQGVALLRFTVDRAGHVLARRIVRSSGHPDLDAEAIAMIERAEPLPAFPATMPQTELDLTVPVSFTLR